LTNRFYTSANSYLARVKNNARLSSIAGYPAIPKN
jgi:hypothetical protein